MKINQLSKYIPYIIILILAICLWFKGCNNKVALSDNTTIKTNIKKKNNKITRKNSKIKSENKTTTRTNKPRTKSTKMNKKTTLKNDKIKKTTTNKKTKRVKKEEGLFDNLLSNFT